MTHIKIGITGVHGAGKTTKAIDLMEHYTFLGNKVIVVDEVARLCPYALGTIEAQEWIWSEQMASEKAAMAQDVDVIICDRTVLGNLMYYRDILDALPWRLMHKICDYAVWDRWWNLYNEAINWMPTYDYVVRMPLNPEWLQVDDSIRSKDVEYAKRIDKLFDRFVEHFVTDHGEVGL